MAIFPRKVGISTRLLFNELMLFPFTWGITPKKILVKKSGVDSLCAIHSATNSAVNEILLFYEFSLAVASKNKDFKDILYVFKYILCQCYALKILTFEFFGRFLSSLFYILCKSINITHMIINYNLFVDIGVSNSLVIVEQINFFHSAK